MCKNMANGVPWVDLDVEPQLVKLHRALSIQEHQPHQYQWHTDNLSTSLVHSLFNCHFADDIFKRIFMKEKFCILIKISLKCVPKGPFDNKSLLVQVMAWCRPGDKPLSEAMLTQFTDAYMQQ